MSQFRHAFTILPTVGLVLGLMPPVAAHPHLNARDTSKWWLQDAVQAALDLRDAQAQEIERIFQTALPELRLQTDRLREEEAHLSALLTAADSAETDVIVTIDRVERVRSALAKARTLMLFRMYRVLSPEQRARLEAMSQTTLDAPAQTALPPH